MAQPASPRVAPVRLDENCPQRPHIAVERQSSSTTVSCCGARALVRAVVLVVDRVGSLAVRVGRRWTIFCENLVGATKEARNRFGAHRLRLSLKASGFEAVGPAQHVE